jgi:hypothetical protein
MEDMTYASADGTEEMAQWICADGCPVAEMDRQSGDRPGMSGGGIHREDYAGGMFGGIDSAATARGDHGGASRFMFCAKASQAEKHFGCEHLPGGNIHVAVKPLALLKQLATLMRPPPRRDGQPRRIVVLYSGSGSEMIAALRAGWDEVVGIQRIANDEEQQYVTIAKARLARWAEVPIGMDEAEACAQGRRVAAAESTVTTQRRLFEASE